MRSLIFVLLILLGGCIDDIQETTLEVGLVEGLRPVYSTDWKKISSSAPRPIGQLGKIYYKDQTIYVTEFLHGVHVIDNIDPANPTPVRFLEIPGCRDVAIRGNLMYADNATDLVVLDISDLQDIKVVNRVEGLYSTEDQAFPQSYEGFFECVDPSKGVVLGWETAQLNNPQCSR